MKNRKRYVSFMSLLLVSGIILQSGSTVYAKSDSHTEVLTFETDNKEERRDEAFPQEIKVDGRKHKLTEIVYEVQSRKEKEDKVVESVPMVYGTEADYKPLDEIVEDGITYKLKHSVAEEVVLEEAYTQMVSGYLEYDYPITSGTVPATREFTVTNEKTKEEETVNCKFQNITSMDAGWINTYIDIVFRTYNADVFEWNGVRVTRNTQTPLSGYEKELLESVGASTTDYKVAKTYWTGDAYTDEQGILCRNARADVQKRAISYRANYVGEISQEEVRGLMFTDTYEYQEGQGDHYVIQATGYYEVDSMTQYLTIGAAILIFAVIVILFVLSRKKKKEGGE